MTEDIVIMTDIGHSHKRPNERRLIARKGHGYVKIIEQMNDGQEWEDISQVATFRGRELIAVESG